MVNPFNRKIRIRNKKLGIDEKLPLIRIKKDDPYADCEYIFSSKPIPGLPMTYVKERKNLGHGWKWNWDELFYLYHWMRDERRDIMRRERLAIDSLYVCEKKLHKARSCGRLENRPAKKRDTKINILEIISENESRFYDSKRDLRFVVPIVYGWHILENDIEIGDVLTELNTEKKDIDYIKKYLQRFDILIDLNLRLKEREERGKETKDTYDAVYPLLALVESRSPLILSGNSFAYIKKSEEPDSQQGIIEKMNRSDEPQELKF